MLKRILLTLAVFMVIFAVLFVLRFDLGSKPEPASPPASVIQNIDFSKQTQPPIHNLEFDTTRRLKQTAWIPDWDFRNGFESLQESWQYFDSVSPVWYSLDPKGNTKVNRTGYRELKLFTEQRDIKLIPSIASFAADEFHIILNDDTKLEGHISFLLEEVSKYDYDGIDLDYESIYLEDQPEYLYLIRKLYTALDTQGKLLTIAVMPTWSNADIFRGLRQTREVQNWAEIAEYVHELRIMAYNMTDYVSAYPGPVSPLDWNDALLRYASTKIGMEKVMLGINLYGYDGWSNNNIVPDPYLGLFANPRKAKGQADAVTYKDVQELPGTVISNRLHPSSQEKIIRYRYTEPGKAEKEYVVFFQDLQSAVLRFNVARKYGAAGVAHWRMGSEDLRIYPKVAATR